MVAQDLFLLTIVGVFIVKAYKDLCAYSDRHNSLNTPHIYCLVALSFQILGIMSDLCHQLKYSSNGRGYLVLDVFSTILDGVSSSIMTMLILMMANGWMTSFVKTNEDDYLDLYLPLMMIILFVHIVFGALTFVDQDAHHKYHDFHGWQGYFLVLCKFIIAGADVVIYLIYRKKVPKSSLAFFD